jgi:hypothetical protein
MKLLFNQGMPLLSRSRCFNSQDLAEKYFDDLTAELRMERILSQGITKVITGVGNNTGVIPEHQLA